MTAPPPTVIERLAMEPDAEYGATLVSPSATRTFSIGTPSSSAAIWARVVSMPLAHAHHARADDHAAVGVDPHDAGLEAAEVEADDLLHRARTQPGELDLAGVAHAPADPGALGGRGSSLFATRSRTPRRPSA